VLRGIEGQPQLHGLARRARGVPRHDLGAGLRVRREHAVIAQHVKPRRRDQSDESRDQIERVEQDGIRSVSPGALEPVAKPAVTVLLESFLRERRAGDVAAQPLESLAIAIHPPRAADLG
jgi:hypothetical protein